jgi:glycosyltransferase involved in cell wall biosynthesis
MKIGFISAHFPYDPRRSADGIQMRMGMFIEALKQIGDLDMLFYVRPDLPLDADVVGGWERQLSDQFNAGLHLDLCRWSPPRPPNGRWQEYISPALSIGNLFPYLVTAQAEQVEAVRRLLSRKPDILFVHRLISMVPVLLAEAPLPRTYFDLDDIEHVLFSRSIRQPPTWLGKPLLYLRMPILKRWENRAIRASQATFVCSNRDQEYLKRNFGHDRIVVVPNAIDLPRVRAVPKKQTLLFLGRLHSNQNAIAADHLIQNVWPKVLAALPEAELIIAGAGPDCLASYGKRPKGVTFPGFVEDLEKLYEDVAAVCCPVLYGSGTRVKILEAAAYGKPVVSTTVGAEGIDLKDGEEILLRDDPDSFAEACIRLLTDNALASRMGRSARAVIEKQHERAAVVRSIGRAIAHGAGNALPAKAPSEGPMISRDAGNPPGDVSGGGNQEAKLCFLLTIALSGTGRDDQDLERMKLLVRSFTKYFDARGLSKFLVVTTARDIAAVKGAIEPMFEAGKLAILDENEVCPELASDPDTTRQWPKPNKGWYRQQLIKLAICERIDTPFYMTLDSDVLFVKPFDTSSLIRGGKAVLNVQTEADYARLYRKKFVAHEVKVRETRYREAEAVLNCRRKPEYLKEWYGETPVLLNCRIARALAERIEATWSKPWRQALLERLPWTEYPLYFLFAEDQGLLQQHYIRGTSDSVLRLSRSLWQSADQYVAHRDLANWDPGSIFDAGDEGIAVVVQSYLGYPVADIARRISPYLEKKR